MAETTLLLQRQHWPAELLERLQRQHPAPWRSYGQWAWWVDAAELALEPLRAFAAAEGIDLALVPRQRRPQDIRLIASDMDSTFITMECIDQWAELAGCYPQVARITHQSMSGHSDFSTSLHQRLALLAGRPRSDWLWLWQHRLRLMSGMAELLARARAQGTAVVLLSGGFDFFTQRLMQRLGLSGAVANQLAFDAADRFTGQCAAAVIDAAAKAEHLRQFQRRWGIAPEQTLVLGDGANDMLMCREAGISIAYHAKASLKNVATHSLDAVDWRGAWPLLGACGE